ncbi:hypothetical protein Hanom_Chr13g01224101 [Helianthus anomalus]
MAQTTGTKMAFNSFFFKFRVKMSFLSPRFGHFCDFRPKVCFSASGSKRFEILPFELSFKLTKKTKILLT